MKEKKIIRYSYTAAGENSGHGVIDIVGIFGEDADDSLVFRGHVEDALKQGCTRLTVRVNSPGGCLFSAFAMYDALKSARAAGCEVVAEVHGVAASAASVVIMAAERVLMSENSQLMLHAPSTCVWGRLDELQEQVDSLRDSWLRMCAIYSERTGTPAEELSATLQRDTWYTAAQAIEAKLADGTVEPFELADTEKQSGTLRQAAAEIARRAGAWLMPHKRAAQAEGEPTEDGNAASPLQLMQQRLAMQAEKLAELTAAAADAKAARDAALADAAAARAELQAVQQAAEAECAQISARIEREVANRLAAVGAPLAPAPAEPVAPRKLTDAQVQALITGARTGALLEYSATSGEAYHQVERLLAATEN